MTGVMTRGGSIAGRAREHADLSARRRGTVVPHRLALAAVVALGAPGCLRPSEERVYQDMRVGQATGSGLRVEVEDGRAAVRALDAGRITLWASAPRLALNVAFEATPPAELALDVQNCMPSAALESTPALVVQQSERTPSGVCRFVVAVPADVAGVRLAVAPPGSDVPSAFRFAVMSDVQEAIPRVQDIYRVLNAQTGIDFLLGAGDLTEQGTRDELVRFQRELEQLSIPYYTTLGNHELGQAPTLYHEYFGRGSQSFEYRGVRFTLLDSASATIDPIVFEWLDGWLALGAAAPHVVAMHIPPLDPVGVRNGAFANRHEAAKLLGRLAASGVDLTLYGHIHSYYAFDNASIPAFISGGGGAIPERFDDLGRHVLLVDVEPAAPRFDVQILRVD